MGPNVQPLPTSDSADFYKSLPPMRGFLHVADPANYHPVPDDWEIGLADVVRSTEAVAAGRYKAVNTAGAAPISAVSNALGTLDFPFVFTGDGMAYAVAPEQAEPARRALAATLPWVGSALGLELRGGVIAVSAIRAAGREVRLARFTPSGNVAYAMFSGGGLAWAEGQLKSGRLTLPKLEAGARPDLNGLSCRFKALASDKGVIVSVIVTPRSERGGDAFAATVDAVVDIVTSSPEAARPITQDALSFRWPSRGLALEARLVRRAWEPLVLSYLRRGAYEMLGAAALWLDGAVGRFSPRRYREEVVENSDFRKFEDGLMMTVDCTPALADRIEAGLAEAKAEGIIDYGLHRQDAALITCIVPSPISPHHVHLIDGAAGGYTAAAQALKRGRTGNNQALGRNGEPMPSSAAAAGGYQRQAGT